MNESRLEFVGERVHHANGMQVPDGLDPAGAHFGLRLSSYKTALDASKRRGMRFGSSILTANDWTRGQPRAERVPDLHRLRMGQFLSRPQAVDLLDSNHGPFSTTISAVC